tara:strand:- start:122 stop:328 length:207 start_codon:yes stop_codon:yes gene_type:complete
MSFLVSILGGLESESGLELELELGLEPELELELGLESSELVMVRLSLGFAGALPFAGILKLGGGVKVN